MKEATFTVTRQSRWPDGEQIVEVSQGGIDYSGSDALCAKYPGEMEEFIGLTPATEAAIAIAKAWAADAPDKQINIAVGNTHGMGLALSEEPATEEVFARLLSEAQQFDEKLPHCEQCGNIMGKETWHPYEYEEEECCSEYCAEELGNYNRKESCQAMVEDLSREEVVALLEAASVQCYKHESDETLKKALVVNILDGTIEL